MSEHGLRPLLFDGAMGTYYKSLYPADEQPCELACLDHPQRVSAIHAQYLDAGAQAVKTNSFAANTAVLPGGLSQALQVVRAAYALAKQACAGRQAQVFADIGPIPGGDPAEYDAIVDAFLQLGADRFLLETFAEEQAPLRMARRIKAARPDALVIVSFAVSPDGFSQSGRSLLSLLRPLDQESAVDLLGLNCVSGPFHLLQLVRSLPPLHKPLSVMPNAGSPKELSGRTYFPASPAYFASQLAQLAPYAKVLGGCCGTTPAFIAAAAQALRHGAIPAEPRSQEPQAASAPPTARDVSPFFRALESGETPIAVELDPPAARDLAPFLNGARRLQAAGAQALTISDCPIARVRADSSLLAAKLHRELGLETIPHMTCRDRNLLAAKALLLGLSLEGVPSVLAVTGDPIPTNDRGVQGVFSFNSVLLMRYIAELSEQLAWPFRIYGALNVNARNFDAELDKARRKQEAGACGFFTQPVSSDRALANLETARRRLSAKLLGGVMPVLSHRNALFLQNEVSGVYLPDELVARYEGLDKKSSHALALELSVQMARRMSPLVDGYYLMTPLGNVRIMEKLIAAIRQG